jgi:arginase
MVMSHIVGQGAHALTHIGTRYPLMPEENIVLFGYNSESGWIDPAEMQRLDESSMLRYPATQIRGKAARAATEALVQLDASVQQILVHFDVDVIDRRDFGAADVLHDHGLSFDEAMLALKVFVSSPKFVGLAVTEFNADRDKDGSLARRLVEALSELLIVAAEKRGGGKNPATS